MVHLCPMRRVAQAMNDTPDVRNPFAEAEKVTPQRNSTRPVPTVVIGATVILAWLLFDLADVFQVVHDLAPVTLMVIVIAMSKWARSG